MKADSGKKPGTLLGSATAVAVALLFYFLQGGRADTSSTAREAPPTPTTTTTQQRIVQEEAASQPERVVQKAPETKARPKAPQVQEESRSHAHWHRANLQRHWEKHQAEFPECASAEAYGEAARALADNPPEGTLRKTTADGDQMLYHPPTNRFLVMTADGTIKTCFKPDQGINYWRRQ